ncbi:hypothetical protein ACPRNU_09985 [Chromobacterium vaccinii]|uniref:hypothetical protein n=1 Tax=Chromobacterium vaccinii TaxID=1108595 RepID=UPI003C726B43
MLEFDARTITNVVMPLLLFIPLAYGMLLENSRRERIAREMAEKWLNTEHPGCVIREMDSSAVTMPVSVIMKVRTPKNEDFEIKLKVGTIFGGVFMGKIKVVYIRRKNPPSEPKENA